MLSIKGYLANGDIILFLGFTRAELSRIQNKTGNGEFIVDVDLRELKEGGKEVTRIAIFGGEDDRDLMAQLEAWQTKSVPTTH